MCTSLESDKKQTFKHNKKQTFYFMQTSMRMYHMISQQMKYFHTYVAYINCINGMTWLCNKTLLDIAAVVCNIKLLASVIFFCNIYSENYLHYQLDATWFILKEITYDYYSSFAIINSLI